MLKLSLFLCKCAFLSVIKSTYIFHYRSHYFLPTILFHLMRFFTLLLLLLCRLFSFPLYLSPHTQFTFPHLQVNANLYTCIYYILSCFSCMTSYDSYCLFNLTTYHLFHTHFFTTNNNIFLIF